VTNLYVRDLLAATNTKGASTCKSGCSRQSQSPEALESLIGLVAQTRLLMHSEIVGFELLKLLSTSAYPIASLLLYSSVPPASISKAKNSFIISDCRSEAFVASSRRQ
jgi:hypothetical protein